MKVGATADSNPSKIISQWFGTNGSDQLKLDSIELEGLTSVEIVTSFEYVKANRKHGKASPTMIRSSPSTIKSNWPPVRWNSQPQTVALTKRHHSSTTWTRWRRKLSSRIVFEFQLTNFVTFYCTILQNSANEKWPAFPSSRWRNQRAVQLMLAYSCVFPLPAQLAARELWPERIWTCIFKDFIKISIASTTTAMRRGSTMQQVSQGDVKRN